MALIYANMLEHDKEMLSKLDSVLDKITSAKKCDQNQCHFCRQVFQSQLGFSRQENSKYCENISLLQQ